MSNDPRKPLERALNTFGSCTGIDGGGETNVPQHRPAEYGRKNGDGSLTLGTYDRNSAWERPVGALGGEYNVFDRGDGRSTAGGMYARGIGSNAAQISEG